MDISRKVSRSGGDVLQDNSQLDESQCDILDQEDVRDEIQQHNARNDTRHQDNDASDDRYDDTPGDSRRDDTRSYGQQDDAQGNDDIRDSRGQDDARQDDAWKDSQSQQRPAGGTSRAAPSGGRTPRKVQWLDNKGSLGVDSPAHMLDEEAMDPEAFHALTEALEQHRRATPLSKVHYYPPAQPSEDAVNMSSSSDEEDDEGGYASSVYPASIASSRVLQDTPPKVTRDVPDVYISEDEDAGLPGTKDLRSFSMRKAQNVVNGHLKKGSHRWRSSDRASSEKQPIRDQSPDSDRDVENDGQRMGNTHSGGGVLSALLNLYQRPESTYSGRSSRQSSYDGNSVYSSDFGSIFRLLPHSPQMQSPQKIERRAEKRREKAARVYTNKRRFDMPNIFGHISRPPAARNAGGVFGPLIASTGNLMGVAAPIAGQLQPNLNRPGYNLSRYSLETKGVPRPPAARRRNSFDFDRQSLAGSGYAPTIRSDGGATPPSTPPGEREMYNHSNRSNLSGILGNYVSSIRSGRRSGYSTPTASDREQINSKQLPKRRGKRKKAEVFITRHIAQVIRREEFILKLTRAMMMFGAPPHRLQPQIQSAARVLELNINFIYFPDLVIMSFDDTGTGTSHIKVIRQASALNLTKLDEAFSLYWKVIHDKLSVSDASVALDELMKKKPYYNRPAMIIIGGLCSASICTVSFGGSFIDALLSFPLGALLVLIQILSVRNVLYTYVFEVTATTLFSFIAAALAATHKLCYSAITSSSVVLILPGFLVLTGSLDLMSRHIVPGSVRMLFAVVYALFLGFGFTIGAQFFELFTGHKVYGAEDYTCSMTHDPLGPWYQRTPSIWWAFLTVPMYSACLSMRNHARWNSKEMVLLVGIACIGWVTNYFTGRRFVGQSDIIAAVGAFAVGLVANLYARVFKGNAFVVMIIGILFQLPSGLGSGGLLSYASQQASGSTDSYLSGFQTALKLVSVAIGLTIGLGLSLVITHPIQSRKREAGIFSL